MLSCSVISRFAIPAAPSLLFHSRTSHIPLALTRQNAILCFQSLAHSSQFTKRKNPTIFCGLRTLWQKHPGVVSAFLSRSVQVRLTPVKSKRYTKLVSNPLGMKPLHETPGVGVPLPLSRKSFVSYA